MLAARTYEYSVEFSVFITSGIFFLSAYYPIESMESMNSISGHDTILLVAAYAKRASHLLEKLNKSNKGSTKIDDLIASLKSVEHSINSILDGLLVDENLETNVSSSTLNLISTLDSSNCNEMSSIHSGSNINIKRKLSSKDVTEKNEQPVKKKSKDKDKISDPDNNSSNNEDIDTDDAVTKGKRRWEVRRMRQHDVDAVNVNPKETSKIDNSPINAAECAGGAAGGVPKKLNVSASVESAHKQTQSRCLTPKSPSRIPEGDSTNRNNSLWNKKGLKKDPGHSVCPVTSWFCTVCTLENPMRARMCLACNSHRYYGVKNTNGDSSNTELASALLLDNIPGTPRKKNPSMMKSLYVNREPKIGPEHQISLDDLPIPRSELDLYPDVDALGNSSSYWTPSWIPPKDSKYLFDSLAMRLYLSNMESKADEPEALRILYAANFDISAATDAFRNELRERNAMGNWYDSNSDEPPVLHSLNRDSLLPIRSPFVVKLSEVLPPQASQLTTSAIPNNNTSSSSGLSVDSPNYSNDVAICPVYNSFVKCMGMYWKDWNKIVVSLLVSYLMCH